MTNLLKLAEELIDRLLIEGEFWKTSERLNSLSDKWDATKESRDDIVKQWDDHNHYVNFTGHDFWTVQHPLAERLNGSLMDCKINNDVDDWTWADAPPMGLFRAWPDPSWSCWAFEPVLDNPAVIL